MAPTLRAIKRIALPFAVKAIAALSFAILSALPVHAQNLLLNPGFEDPDVPFGGFTGFTTGQTIGSGWLVEFATVNVAVTHKDHVSGVGWHDPTEGNQFLYVGNNITASTVSQSVILTPDDYRLQFDMSAFAISQTWSDARLTIDVVNNALVSSLGGPQLITLSNNAGYTTFAFAFTVPTTDTYTVRFSTVDAIPANLDNFSLASATVAAPEPGTLALLGLIGAPFVAGRVRRRKA